MFAFSLWDGRHWRLMLARDPVDKKPLFDRATPSTLWFGSEPRAILMDPELMRELDPIAIDSYLRFQYVPHPRSAHAGMSKLPPGHVLLWEDGRSTIRPYWALSYGQHDDVTMTEAADIVRSELLEATRLRLRSDVPLGAFLPAVVDSSAVVAVTAWQSPGRVKTFSIGFDVPGFDETPYARQVAERYDTDITSSKLRRTRSASCLGSSGTSVSRSPTHRRCRASTLQS